MRIDRRATLGIIGLALGIGLFFVSQQNLAECQTLAGQAAQAVSPQASSDCQLYQYLRIGGGGLAGVGILAVLSGVRWSSPASQTRDGTATESEKPGTFRERLVYKLGIGFSVLLLPTSLFGVFGFLNASTSRSGTTGITIIFLLWAVVPPGALLYFIREYRDLSYASSSNGSQAVQQSDDASGIPTGSGGTLRIHNARFQEVTYRVRCRTKDQVIFNRQSTLLEGAEAQVGKLPATTPFEITVTIKDGPTKTKIFESDMKTAKGVVVRVNDDGIMITGSNLNTKA